MTRESTPRRRAGRPEDVAAKEQHQLALLRAISDLPWAEARLLQAYSHLPTYPFQSAVRALLASNQIERADIPTRERRAPQRYGLAPLGAARLGLRFAPALWRTTLLAALRYEPARLLLVKFLQTAEVLWVLSPFTLPAEAVRAERSSMASGRPLPANAKPYRPVAMELLACLRLSCERYLNVVVLVDPGGISLEPLRESLRSLAAWGRRAEFRGRALAFPLVVIVAANPERAQALIEHWRCVELRAAGSVRASTWAQLAHSHRGRRPFAEWPWWNERHQPSAFWPGLIFSPCPSRRPAQSSTAWWADAGEADEIDNPELLPALKLKRGTRLRGVVAQANLNDKKQSPRRHSKDSHSSAMDWPQAVRDHLQTTAMGRRLLDRIGVYPLVNATDLACILGLDAGNVRREVSRLRQAGLIEHPAPEDAGYGLTWRGLALLAAQAGFLPRPYAALRRWPVSDGDHGPRYSLGYVLRVREHTQIILDFLVGLRRAAELERLALQRWEHLQLMEESMALGQEVPVARLMPDAEGRVRSFGQTTGQSVDTPFWLEVDRGTLKGRALHEKLRRYYRLRGDTPGVRGRPERLLIVVERDAEGRLRSLCRHLKQLDDMYHTRLDVRLTRLDLITDRPGRLDPTRVVWRTPYDNHFRSPFRRWGDADE